MSYDHKDNPLRHVKVEVPETCREKYHLQNLVYFGVCPGCEKKLGKVTEADKVFDRLNQLTAPEA